MSGEGNRETAPGAGSGLNPFQMQALTQHFERLLKQQADDFHAALEQRDNNREEDGRRHRRNRDEEPRQDRVEGVKLNIPPFQGKNDPEAYLEWELKITHFFSCNNYSEAQKLKLASAEFSGYALIWWTKYQRERIQNEEPPVDTWEEMRSIMRKRYVPASYQRELKLKLQRMVQGTRSVEDYYKDMEVTMMRAKINEDMEVTMARFLSGLNHDIRDVVELQNYMEIEDLVHKATQVEQQLKRKSTARRSSSNTSPTRWKDHSKKEGTSSSTTSTPNGKTPMKRNESPPKGGSRGVKCFKCLGRGHLASECPTKRVIVLKNNGEYTSESETSEGGKSENEEEEVSPVEGDLLMVRRLMGNQIRVFDETQRENIFHTRCLVDGKVCTVIVDGGSCTNVASARIVSKLNLNTKPHPKPYKLHWLSEGGDLIVSEQVELCLSMGKYDGKVLCDVVPMAASHILLGRPWQYDTKAVHDGFTNNITFTHQNKKIVLKPLSPREVSEDQMKMREKLAQERKESKSDTQISNKSEEKECDTIEKRVLVTRKDGIENTIKDHANHSDMICSSMYTYDLQEKKENGIREKDHSQASMKNLLKAVDIIPSSPLYTKPSFGSSMPASQGALDLRTNPLQEGGDDEDQGGVLQELKNEVWASSTFDPRGRDKPYKPQMVPRIFPIEDP